MDSKSSVLPACCFLLRAWSTHGPSVNSKGPPVIHLYADHNSCVSWQTNFLFHNWYTPLPPHTQTCTHMNHNKGKKRLSYDFWEIWPTYVYSDGICRVTTVLQCHSSVTVFHGEELKQGRHFVVVDSCCLVLPLAVWLAHLSIGGAAHLQFVPRTAL